MIEDSGIQCQYLSAQVATEACEVLTLDIGSIRREDYAFTVQP